MRKLLTFAAKENHFSFNSDLYDQVDGVAMGSPLGPVLANIFMSKLETDALRTYTGKKPLLYRRYVDDTFLIFQSASDTDNFFRWMNQQHRNIKFTKEDEHDGQLPFLDVLVKRELDGSLQTTVYRKPSFSGLYLKWSSFVPKPFKRGLVNCLLYRAWRICSTYTLFHQEVTFIRQILLSNDYPETFIDSCINRFVSSKMTNGYGVSLPMFGPDKKRIVLSLPFCGSNSLKLKRQLKRMLNIVAPWIDLCIVFKPAFKIQQLSKLKDQFPKSILSHVIYKINCKHCQEFYIGMTCRRLEDRLSEHVSSNSSALFRHSSDTSHVIDFDSPQILARDTIKTRLLVKETLKIQEFHAEKSLNRNVGSFELKFW